MSNEHVGTRWCFAKVRARFEVHIDRTLCEQCWIVDTVHGVHFGVGLAIFFVPAFTNDLAVVHDDTTHQWVWTHLSTTECGQLECAAHKKLVGMMVVFGHWLILAKIAKR